jgi:hypothetical protein
MEMGDQSQEDMSDRLTQARVGVVARRQPSGEAPSELGLPASPGRGVALDSASSRARFSRSFPTSIAFAVLGLSLF